MALTSISGISTVIPNSIIAERHREQLPKTDFAEFLQNALGNTVKTDLNDKITNVGVMTDDSIDIHTATIAAEKADLTLRLTLAVRNKIIDAYTEVMRMQI